MRLTPLLLLGLSGCATFAFPGSRAAIGVGYSDVRTPQRPTPNRTGEKTGEACAVSILGLVTTGDAGVRAAADAAGITHVSAVDTTFRNILGVWSRYCTVVSGDGEPLEAPPPEPAIEPAPDGQAPEGPETPEAPTPDEAPAPAPPVPAPEPEPAPG